MAVISQQVLEESLRNINEKIPNLLVSFQQLIIDYPPQLIPDPKIINPTIRGLVASEDQPIFTSAMRAKVDYFVTGNTKDFKVKKHWRRKPR